MGRLLLQGGVVVSLDRQVGNHARADVLVEDGRITEVGPDLRGRGAEVVDATDGLVMPGLVDGHRHAWRSLGRNAVPGSQPPAPRDHTPDDVHAATLLTLAGAAEIGTTTLAHWLDGALAADAILAAGRAHREAGLRGVLVVEHRADVDLGEMVRDLALPDDTHGPGAPLLVVAIGVTDPERYDDAALAAIWRSAQAEDLRVHVRLGTTAAARGQVARLDRLGLLDQRVTVVHATHLDEPDLESLAARGAGLVLTPTVDLLAGRGLPPLQQLLDRGVRPGLGVDDDTAAPGDVFTQMRTVQSLQHAAVFDRKLAGKAGLPALLNTRDVIRYATTDGATALGLGATTGTLTPGRAADLLVLRTDHPNIFPVNDPIGAVVWGMNGANVRDVFVAGRAVVRDGVLTADRARIRQAALDAHARVSAAADLVRTTDGGAR